MQIILDEGYQFGLGAFETIAVENGRPILLEEHLDRLMNTMDFLGIGYDADFVPAMRKRIDEYLLGRDSAHMALKIIASQKNILLTSRQNIYNQAQYEKGFTADFSPIYRNETSPLVFHKTMNYGDCIMEKRRAVSMGLDELFFLNSRGEVCEGTTTNIFFVKAGNIYTPKLSCGLLPGIMRSYLMKMYHVEECIIHSSQITEYEECFVTNSLMGVMPVTMLKNHRFLSREKAEWLQHEYIEKLVKKQS